MPNDVETIKSIAKESLMPDFFSARIEEEGLWNATQQLLVGIQAPHPIIDKIKQLARGASSGTDFIEKVKAAKLWLEVKELIARIQVK